MQASLPQSCGTFATLIQCSSPHKQSTLRLLDTPGLYHSGVSVEKGHARLLRTSRLRPILMTAAAYLPRVLPGRSGGVS